MDGTRLALGKRRLNRIQDIRLLLADLARKLEKDYMGPPGAPNENLLDPKEVSAYLNVIVELGKLVEKRELDTLQKRVQVLRAQVKAEQTGTPALTAVPPAS